MRKALVVGAAVVAVSSAFAAVTAAASYFPRIRDGIGSEPTAGGGYVAGARFEPHSAVVAWNLRRRDLTLYLIRAPEANCRNFIRLATRPGRLVQAVLPSRGLTNRLGHAIPGQSLQFITYYKQKNRPFQVSGLREGVKLVLTRVDTYPRGVWHGTLNVPMKFYADGRLYGYRGSFAARWCVRRS